jgi:hypothetical protein
MRIGLHLCLCPQRDPLPKINMRNIIGVVLGRGKGSDELNDVCIIDCRRQGILSFFETFHDTTATPHLKLCWVVVWLKIDEA